MANNSVAIVIAGALIAAALLAGLMVDRYELAGGFAVDGTPAIWRFNSRTGTVSLCMLARDPHPTAPDPVEQYIVQCRN